MYHINQDIQTIIRTRPGNRRRVRAIAKMVYDWENKEEICYRMYIEEKKSLEEIMDYMKEHHKFAPR
jgi:Clr5 domain